MPGSYFALSITFFWITEFFTQSLFKAYFSKKLRNFLEGAGFISGIILK
jgi:hypothetical protein